MVSRELLLSEARRLQLREPPEADVDAALRDLAKQFETPGDFSRFMTRIGFTDRVKKRAPPPLRPGAPLAPEELPRAEAAPPGLLAILRSELEVDRFIALRVRGNVVISGTEVERCFAFNKGSIPKDVIKDRLEKQEQDRALRALLRQLEKKTQIRYAPDFRQESVVASDDADKQTEVRCPTEESLPSGVRGRSG
jgi:hypothetical protein